MSSKEIVGKSGLIGSIASKLNTIEVNKIIRLPKTVFYSIVKNDKLTVESEDELLDNNTNLNEENEESSSSLCVPDFEFLIEYKFREFVGNFDVNKITASLWVNLKKCFYVYKKTFSSSPPSSLLPKWRMHHYSCQNTCVEKIGYDVQHEHTFDGIIRKLTKETGGNLNDKEVVAASASATYKHLQFN